MALTFTFKKDMFPHVGKGRKLKVYEVRFDNSYVTDGYAVTAANVGLTQIDFMHIEGVDNYIVLKIDHANKKIIAVAPHNSAGTGGHQLNGGSTVLNNTLAILYAYGS